MTAPEHDLDTRPATSTLRARGDSAANGPLIDAAEADGLQTSFGVFKPVGHVMVGLPSQTQVDALTVALHGAGWPGARVRQFSPQESVAELQAMLDKAGPLSDFGYEIVLLRRYLSLTLEGYRWLLVQADDAEAAEAVAKAARAHGATVAVHYRTLTVEELIE